MCFLLGLQDTISQHQTKKQEKMTGPIKTQTSWRAAAENVKLLVRGNSYTITIHFYLL